MPAPPTVELAVETELARLVPGWPAARLCVALSGGVDSTTLLHVCRRIGATHPGLTLRAVHIHHGLQTAAASWEAHCRALSAGLGIPFESASLDLVPPAGASIEAFAREARYAALRERLVPGEALLTAHHEDDQLETVLLQLFRGAGVAGLAAMPAAATLGEGLLLRPMLGVTRAAIEAYANAAGLPRIDDPTNLSRRFDRGLLRREITPLLRARWPSVSRSVARSARHAAAAQSLLNELAELDAVGAVEQGRLLAARLAQLSRARQANLLRWWLRGAGLGMPSEARLVSILDDLLPARAGAQPAVTWPAGEVRRHRGWLYAMRPLPRVRANSWALYPDQVLAVDGVGSISLVSGEGSGISADRYRVPFEVRLRQGGERMLASGHHAEKSVTRLLREAGTEPWLRDRAPLIWSGQMLLAVGDLCVAAHAAVAPGERGYRVLWTRSA